MSSAEAFEDAEVHVEAKTPDSSEQLPSTSASSTGGGGSAPLAEVISSGNVAPSAPATPSITSMTPSNGGSSYRGVHLVECKPVNKLIRVSKRPHDPGNNHLKWAKTPTGQWVNVRSTTAVLPNRLQDKQRIEQELGLMEFGERDNSMQFFAVRNGLLPIALGYERIVYGDAGPYIEFSSHHIIWDSWPEFIRTRRGCYYDEYWTEHRTTMLYAQKRPVTDKPNPPSMGEYWCQNNRPEGYANYRVGKYYLECSRDVILARRLEDAPSSSASSKTRRRAKNRANANGAASDKISKGPEDMFESDEDNQEEGSVGSAPERSECTTRISENVNDSTKDEPTERDKELKEIDNDQTDSKSNYVKETTLIDKVQEDQLQVDTEDKDMRQQQDTGSAVPESSKKGDFENTDRHEETRNAERWEAGDEEVEREEWSAKDGDAVEQDAEEWEEEAWWDAEWGDEWGEGEWDDAGWEDEWGEGDWGAEEWEEDWEDEGEEWEAGDENWWHSIWWDDESWDEEWHETNDRKKKKTATKWKIKNNELLEKDNSDTVKWSRKIEENGKSESCSDEGSTGSNKSEGTEEWGDEDWEGDWSEDGWWEGEDWWDNGWWWESEDWSEADAWWDDEWWDEEWWEEDDDEAWEWEEAGQKSVGDKSCKSAKASSSFVADSTSHVGDAIELHEDSGSKPLPLVLAARRAGADLTAKRPFKRSTPAQETPSEPMKAISSEALSEAFSRKPTESINIFIEAPKPSSTNDRHVLEKSAASGESAASESPKKPERNYEVIYREVGGDKMSADADGFVPEQLPMLDAYGCFDPTAMSAHSGYGDFSSTPAQETSSEPTKSISGKPTSAKAISSEPTEVTCMSIETPQPSATDDSHLPEKNNEFGKSAASESPKKPKRNYEVIYREVGGDKMSADADGFVPEQLPMLDAYGCFDPTAMSAYSACGDFSRTPAQETSSEPTKSISGKPTSAKAISSEPTESMSIETPQPSATDDSHVPEKNTEFGKSAASECPKKPKRNYEVIYREVGGDKMSADADGFVPEQLPMDAYGCFDPTAMSAYSGYSDFSGYMDPLSYGVHPVPMNMSGMQYGMGSQWDGVPPLGDYGQQALYDKSVEASPEVHGAFAPMGGTLNTYTQDLYGAAPDGSVLDGTTRDGLNANAGCFVPPDGSGS